MVNQFIKLRGKAFSLLVFLSVFCSVNGYSQQKIELKGKVLNKNKQPLPFCHIIIKGNESKGVVSNYNGDFIINAEIKDTLLFSYLGYENKEVIINNDFITVELNPNILMINEFTVRGRELSPNKIIELTFNTKWKDNHEDESTQDAYVFTTTINLLIKKNKDKVYSFKGSIPIFYIKGKGAFGKEADTIHREEVQPFFKFSSILTEQEQNIVQRRIHPSFLIKNIIGKHIINNLFTFSLGEVTYYKNKLVYQIKYYRKGNKKFCESGGFFLIDKSNFTLLYAENIVKNCPVYSGKRKNEKLEINESYQRSTVLYSSFFENGKYMPISVNVISQIIVSYNEDNPVEYFTSTEVSVKQVKVIQKSKLNLNNWIPIKEVFIK